MKYMGKLTPIKIKSHMQFDKKIFANSNSGCFIARSGEAFLQPWIIPIQIAEAAAPFAAQVDDADDGEC